MVVPKGGTMPCKIGFLTPLPADSGGRRGGELCSGLLRCFAGILIIRVFVWIERDTTCERCYTLPAAWFGKSQAAFSYDNIDNSLFLSNRLTYAAICGLIVPGGKPSHYQCYHKSAPGCCRTVNGGFFFARASGGFQQLCPGMQVAVAVHQATQKGPQALLAGLSYARRGTRTPTGLPIRSLV